MNERLQPENPRKALGADEIIKLAKMSTFDGVAIANEIREGIEKLLKSNPSSEFAEKVRLAYENARRV